MKLVADRSATVRSRETETDRERELEGEKERKMETKMIYLRTDDAQGHAVRLRPEVHREKTNFKSRGKSAPTFTLLENMVKM